MPVGELTAPTPCKDATRRLFTLLELAAVGLEAVHPEESHQTARLGKTVDVLDRNDQRSGREFTHAFDRLEDLPHRKRTKQPLQLAFRPRLLSLQSTEHCVVREFGLDEVFDIALGIFPGGAAEDTADGTLANPRSSCHACEHCFLALLVSGAEEDVVALAGAHPVEGGPCDLGDRIQRQMIKRGFDPATVIVNLLESAAVDSLLVGNALEHGRRDPVDPARTELFESTRKGEGEEGTGTTHLRENHVAGAEAVFGESIPAEEKVEFLALILEGDFA